MRSLYIHIPFCKSKCGYCSFVSYAGRDRLIPGYIEAVKKEASYYKGADAATVYIGGGTPTYPGISYIESLTKAVRRNFRVIPGAEWTIEANPATFGLEKARALRGLGINRVSLGVQSLRPSRLEFLGRPHSAGEALSAFRTLRKAGFSNINLDLIFGIPGQTAEELEDDLLRLTGLESEHISLYALSAGRGSDFEKRGIRPQTEDEQAGLYELIVDLLAQKGYRQYEVSNFAKPGMECRHNITYWRGSEYTGLGCGAHSFMDGERFWNFAGPVKYVAAVQAGESPVEGREPRGRFDRMIETLLFGLRLTDGVDVGDCEMRFEASIDDGRRYTIERFMDDGFLVMDGTRLKTTMKGRLVLDELSSRLV